VQVERKRARSYAETKPVLAKPGAKLQKKNELTALNDDFFKKRCIFLVFL
jgi:hypothetical protein